MTAAERQARLDYLALALASAGPIGDRAAQQRRRAIWAEITYLKRTTPKAERNALARRQGLPEEP